MLRYFEAKSARSIGGPTREYDFAEENSEPKALMIGSIVKWTLSYKLEDETSFHKTVQTVLEYIPRLRLVHFTK